MSAFHRTTILFTFYLYMNIIVGAKRKGLTFVNPYLLVGKLVDDNRNNDEEDTECGRNPQRGKYPYPRPVNDLAKFQHDKCYCECASKTDTLACSSYCCLVVVFHNITFFLCF